MHIPANGADAGGVDGGSIALRYISELRRNDQMIDANSIIGGRYRVTKPLGGGGMKMVYLAEDMRLASRPCALAEMVDSFTDPTMQQQAVAAFQREAECSRSLATSTSRASSIASAIRITTTW